MNCSDVREELLEYEDGAVPASGRKTIEKHLECCPDCRELLAEHREVARRLSAEAAIDPGPGFRMCVMAAIANEPAPQKRSPSRMFWPVAIPVALGGLVGAVALAVSLTALDLPAWQNALSALGPSLAAVYSAGSHLLSALGNVVVRAGMDFSGTLLMALAVDVALIIALATLARAWSQRRLDRAGSVLA